VLRFGEIGAAVAGSGFIGPVHVEALRRLGVRVTGILGSTPEKSRRAAVALDLPKGYASFDEILDDPSVAVVHLAVPNVLHYEMSKLALRRGKHVMCEKPLAMTATQTRELVEVARQSGKAAGVCYNVRFYPLNLDLRERIRSGELGAIHSVFGSYVQDWLLYDTDYNWRITSDKGGKLRAVADIGTHWIDLVTTVTGLQVEAVFADLQTLHRARQRPRGEVETFSGKNSAAAVLEPVDVDTEDGGNVLFRFTNGGRGSLHVSQTTAGRKNCLRYEIAGARGAAAWNSETPEQMWLGSRESSRLLVRDPGQIAEGVRRFANYPGGHVEGFADTFKQCFRAFYERVATGESNAERLYPDFAAGHREVEICEAILQSHEQQRWVPVPQPI
jgi:predicted dehydrogenase